MIAVSQGTIDEYIDDGHIGGLFVEFDEEDGGYVLRNTDIVEESLDLDESMASSDTFKFNGAEASSIQFDFFKDSAIGNMDIVGKKFKAYHYVRLKQDDPVFSGANSLFGGDRLSNNAERLKPYVEQAIDQLDNQGLERYFGHGPKVFDYPWEYTYYREKGRHWDPEAQEYYYDYEAKTVKATGHYTYITPNTQIDGNQLYFKVNAHALYLWANIDVDIEAYIDSRTDTGYGKLPPTYETQQINVVTPVTYKAYYTPSFKKINKPGLYLMDLKVMLVEPGIDPRDDGTYKLSLIQYKDYGTQTVGSTIHFTIPASGNLDIQTFINIDSECACIRGQITGKNNSTAILSSDGEMAYTACNIYPCEKIPLGVFTVDSCPMVIDKKDTRTLRAYDGLYNKDLDKKIEVSNSGISSIGDVLDTYVTPATGLEFGGEKYSVEKEIAYLTSFDDATYIATFPDGSLEELVIATGRFEIIGYSSGLSYDFIKKTYADASYSTRLIYDLEKKYGIRKFVSMWDDEGNDNPFFDHAWYTAYTSIRNAIGSTDFSTPSSIDANGRFTIPIVKSVTITLASEGSAYLKVLGRKGVSEAGKIDMSDPIVPLMNDLLWSEAERRYIHVGQFYINTGQTEPKVVEEGGSVKKNGTRFYFHLVANPSQSVFSRQQSFEFKGNFGRPVTVTYAVAKYRIYVAVDDQETYWQFFSGDYAEIKIKDYAKNMINGIMDQIKAALFKGNIVDGQGAVYNSSDSSVLSSLESYIKENATMSDFRINGGDGQPYPSTTASFDFLTPLAYYVTQYVSSMPAGDSETVEADTCNISNMQEWHNTNTLFEYALPSGTSFNTTARELIGAYAELNGRLFTMDRYGEPQLIKLPAPKQIGGAGYPAEVLYPSDNIYPGDDENQMFLTNDSLLEITYRRTDKPLKFGGVKIYKNDSLVLTRTLAQSGIIVTDPDDRVFYELRNNPFIENYPLSDSQLIDIADMINSNIYELEIFNADAKIIGLPFMTLGDVVALEYGETSIYVLNRKLKGITALYDDLKQQYDI